MSNIPVFILVKGERYSYAYGDGGDKYAYGETILIDSMPKNFVKKHRDALKQLMIYHYLHLTHSIDSLKMSNDLDYARCHFVISTPETREYYLVGEQCDCEFGRNGRVNHKTYVGTLYTDICNDDKTKQVVYISINLGKSAPEWYYGDLEEGILINECDPRWYETNKNNELVKYYMELRDKKQ